ncbi:hypothetical protein MPTK1_3g22570 [Marchantia polymorpha subsp. ruderalis]|uniref:Uncharacterized protein n=2 Tax=Marchantia polymorpha TaxID=3197 RepID=A0AAF6B3N3_MARPO|nr:hypothetical protein MARPO_0024s0035 [Marchantia polymorpha]BBN06617.1 hypothetical protein Mp_3g22570 [Marchantia polymorpha subsp. ruderalis]|eukprot:PTQ43517.1 hypothetical protein MARPO_0024s0035 [Marchantia polymorpha]
MEEKTQFFSRFGNHAFQVHPRQNTEFWARPGDIVIRRMLDYEDLGDEHFSNQVMSLWNFAELYKDMYFSMPERCSNPIERQKFQRLYFRNGDHVIRRGCFKRENNYQFRDYKTIVVYVYWPGYHRYGPFVRLNAICENTYPVGIYLPPLGTVRCRAQSFRFTTSQVGWSLGDLLVRHCRPGPPGVPSPGWSRLLGIGIVTLDSRMDMLKSGDILIKTKGRPIEPDGPRVTAARYNTRLEIYAFIFTQADSDGGDSYWTFMCADSFRYDFADPDSDLKLPIAYGVPQPADIMISIDEEFSNYDPGTERGGYVKFYQNPATSLDKPERLITLYPPTRVPETGPTSFGGPPPNLEAGRAAWLDPGKMCFGDLPVPLGESSRPLVFRFGHWAPNPDQEAEEAWVWVWNPVVELYSRHPRASDGTTYIRHDRTGIDYGAETGMPEFESFSSEELDIHTPIPMADFEIMTGDVVIRRDLRHNVHPFLKYGMLPASDRREGWVRLCPGDLLLRFGQLKDPGHLRIGDIDAHHHHADDPPGNRFIFGVELYGLTLDEDHQGVWLFRGRDEVVFGNIRRYMVPPRPPLDRGGDIRLQGFLDGNPYWYNSPFSATLPTATMVAVGGGRSESEQRARIEARCDNWGEYVSIHYPPRRRTRVPCELFCPEFPSHETGRESVNGSPPVQALSPQPPE